MLAPLVALVLAAESGVPNVTLPLEEYEKLRQLRERPSVTVVELLRVEGSFARRDLTVSLGGRASGTLPSAAFLGGEGFRLFGCEGDALVARPDGGAFTVTPLAPRFTVRCHVALDGSDRLEAQATPAVLEVVARVADGEFVASAGGGGARDFSIVRRLSERAEELPPSVAGKYRVTLLPEETRFAYRLEIRNPNRTHRRFELALAAGEHVASVNTPVAWDVDGGRYRLDLPPGDSVVELSGRLAGERFTPPVDATLQYLLVESHPLIRAEVTSAGKRVGVGEVGLAAQYRGAQAFLLAGRTEVSWKAVRLEALKTAGFAVAGLHQVFFVGADGQVRGETRLSIENQGSPALAIPAAGETTFASVAGEPAFLTKDEQGRLFLPLGQGSQRVVVQDRRPFRGHLGLAAATLDLPVIGVPASRATVELRYPAEWVPLYEELAPAARQHLLDTGDALLLLALLVLAERALAVLRVARRRRWLLAAATTLAAAFTPQLLALGLALSAAPLALAGLAALLRRLHGLRLVAALAGIAAVAVVIVVAALAATSSVLSRGIPPDAAVMLSSPASSAEVPPALAQKLMAARKDAAAAPSAAPQQGGADYQGLPARIEIPPGARRSAFSRELLATDAPRQAFVLLASARLVSALAWATGLAALIVAVLLRRELQAGARELAARFGPRPEPAAADAG